ncbi:ATP-binding protein [Kitasatospora purpeofusca]|uniref:ATP-binding protein n=1 Tax=Kitasatospora purpeofusca TaxID=67352 RepID=UPI00364CAD2A
MTAPPFHARELAPQLGRRAANDHASAGIRQATWRLQPVPAAVGPIRRLAAMTVCAWYPELPAERMDDVRTIVSELVTNAVRHAGADGDLTVELWPTPHGNLAVSVGDGSEQPPTPRSPYDNGQSGYGLSIIAEHCAAWGWHPTPTGKAVYATLAMVGTDEPGAAAQNTRDSGSGS